MTGIDTVCHQNYDFGNIKSVDDLSGAKRKFTDVYTGVNSNPAIDTRGVAFSEGER